MYQTQYGTFHVDATEVKDTGYAAIDRQIAGPSRMVGAEIKVAYEATSAPAAPGPVARVSLVQIVRDLVVVVPVPHQQNIGFNLVQVNGGPDNGTRIDQDFYNDRGTQIVNLDPRYAQQRMLATEKLVCQDPKLGKPKVSPGIDGETTTWGSTGYSGERLSGSKFSLAMLRDQPTITLGPNDTATGGMEFEIGVLFERAGNTAAQWGGSISWGFTLHPVTGVPTLNPIAVVSFAGVSARFQAAVAAWNGGQIPDPVNGGHVTLLQLP